jgi:16S rRNA (cytosine1402-N4)-methyltransferase
MQLDRPYKGFSFSKEGPLDMRMDPETELTAKEIVNRWPEKDIGDLIREYGEEPRWRRAAKAIVDARKKKPIVTTMQLAEIISKALGSRTKGKLHPATLIFQGLRICVNRELEVLSEGLTKAISYLAPLGRIGVISFHRLEDRIVKNVFKERSTFHKEKRGKPAIYPILELLTEKPLGPTPLEERQNPRSRSAKMRFAEKLEAL